MGTPVTVRSQFKVDACFKRFYFFNFIVCMLKAEKHNTHTRRRKWVSINKDTFFIILQKQSFCTCK